MKTTIEFSIRATPGANETKILFVYSGGTSTVPSYENNGMLHRHLLDEIEWWIGLGWFTNNPVYMGG